ncbi:TPA: copper homeostasis membrane protein CopD [Citrobacter freundii]
MMLSSVWVALRFIHFSALMLVFGSALYGAWLAPVSFRRLLARRFLRLQQHAAAMGFISAVLMLAIQGGLMGTGWRDVGSVAVWGAVLQTQFGGVWLWQIIFAFVMLIVAVLVPRNFARLLLIIAAAQFMLLAGVGHATLHDGTAGALQRINHAVHLLCAAAWVGGLLPVIYCMHMAQNRWRQQAITTMMRFSRYGHLFVAGALCSGILNILFITGFSVPWHSLYGQLLILKGVLVLLMVAIALANRYVLVPRIGRKALCAHQWFIRMTKIEWAAGAAVLATVSVFATLEPF